ncbi:MAG: HAMP domain-containing sensor histidine kinase [Lautropia sp.]|nr:HAMP domain-containing sensor histidine kinase [Lautropia sp.]
MIRFRQGRLAHRLLVLGVVTMLPVLCVGGLLVRYQLHGMVLRNMDSAISERMGRVVAGVSVDPERMSRGRRILIDHRLVHDEFRAVFSGWYWQIEMDGVVERSRSLWDTSLSVAEAERVRSDMSLRRLDGPMGMPLFGQTRQVQIGNDLLQVHVYGSGEGHIRDLERIDQVLLVMLSLLGVSLLAVMWLQVRLGLKPMVRLHNNVQRLQRGDKTRVGQGYGPDLDPIAHEIDAVLDRNARMVERARGNAADLSHALKKSLALLNAASGSETVDGGFVSREVASMTRLIERHLSRAGSGAGDLRRIDVGECVQGLLGLMRQLHVNRNLAWSLDIEETVCWRGEITDLEEMLGNVLDNAGKWARYRVRVVVRHVNLLPAGRPSDPSARDRHVEITVSDDGKGLDEAGMMEAMQRGRRLDERVEGSGLGLSITADIAETYGGTVKLRRAQMGGLEVVIRLPG